MIGGILLTSLGALGMGVGTAIYTDAASCSPHSFDAEFQTGCPDTPGGKLVGMTVLLSSAVGSAIGVPLWIYGAEKVAALPEKPPPVQEVSVRVGPASALLHVSF